MGWLTVSLSQPVSNRTEAGGVGWKNSFIACACTVNVHVCAYECVCARLLFTQKVTIYLVPSSKKSVKRTKSVVRKQVASRCCAIECVNLYINVAP